jgi:carboxyl-terminal processing protease
MRTYLLSLTLFFSLCLSAQHSLTEKNQDFARQLHILNRVLTNLDVHYVDTLDAKKVIEGGIHYMLYNLDPYTQYIPEEDRKEFLESTTGKYGGIGSPISYDEKRERCYFSYPYDGMPAAQAGVRTGDFILQVDGEDLKRNEGEKPADYSQRVTSKLRGEAGSTFKLLVERPGVNDNVELTLTRRVIEVSNVPYYGMVDEGVGIIMVNSFMENTARDVRRAFVALKQMGMTHLILDLRGNPGGLVSEAVDLVGFFMPNGTKVVTMKGKGAEQEQVYLTEDEPLDTKIPILVLVDDSSASASEITAGTLQDYDRAIVVGERTYGKGLVQQSMDLPEGGILKFTSSKYFIPSGRCIQAYDFKNRGEDGRPQHVPDSLAKTFYTKAGRPVKDGGGVMPDSVMMVPTLPDFVYDLALDPVVQDFAVRYRNTRELPSFESFTMSDADYDELKQYVMESSFSYKPQSLRMLDALDEVIKKEKIEATSELQTLRSLLTPSVADEMERHREMISSLVTLIIIRMAYAEPQFYEAKYKRDEVLKQALNLLHNSEACKAILKK